MDFETKYAISGGVLCMFTIFYHKAYSKGICRFRNSDNEDLKKPHKLNRKAPPLLSPTNHLLDRPHY